MLKRYQQLLTNQFEASLCTLGQCVERCPNSLWNVSVARYPFCQTAYHTLFFTDFYLGLNADVFKEQTFHKSHPELFGDYEQMEDREPVCLYDKPQIRMYLQHCRDKAIETIALETEESFAEPARFSRRSFSRAELHVYNMRHIQHHAAQLILRLRLDTDVDIPWIGSGWRDFKSV